MRFLVDPISQWMESERKTLVRLVNRNSWKIANSNHLLLLLYFWKRSIFKLHRCVKRFLQISQARVAAMTRLYTKQLSTASASPRRGSLLSAANLGDSLSLNISARRRIASDYIRSYLHNYCRLLKQYHESEDPTKKRPAFCLYSDKPPMVSYFLIASTGLQNSSAHKKRNTEFFNNFAKPAGRSFHVAPLK